MSVSVRITGAGTIARHHADAIYESADKRKTVSEPHSS